MHTSSYRLHAFTTPLFFLTLYRVSNKRIPALSRVRYTIFFNLRIIFAFQAPLSRYYLGHSLRSNKLLIVFMMKNLTFENGLLKSKKGRKGLVFLMILTRRLVGYLFNFWKLSMKWFSVQIHASLKLQLFRFNC